MEFVEKIKGILTEPSKTFDSLKGETLGESIKYYAIIAVISDALLFALGFDTMFGQLRTMIGASAGAAGAIVIFVILFIFQIIYIFIFGAIFHIFVYLAGGRKGLTQTIKVGIYGSTPGLLIWWIPFIGIIGGLWQLVLGVLGIRQLHEMTTGRAVLAVVVNVVIVLLVAVIAAFVFGLGGHGRGY